MTDYLDEQTWQTYAVQQKRYFIMLWWKAYMRYQVILRALFFLD